MNKMRITKSLRRYPAALNVKEVSEILRVSTKTVYKLIDSGSFPAVKVGRENRVAKSRLINYLVSGNHADSNSRKILSKQS